MRDELPGGWRRTRIGQEFSHITRNNSAGITRVLTMSGEQGLIDQAVFFNKRVAAESVTGYYHLQHGEFAYNRSAMTGYPFGAIKRLDRYAEGVLSTLYLCFRLNESAALSSDYAVQLFDSGVLDEELRPIVRVGARAHGLLNVTPSEFMNVPLMLPTRAEQDKIARILASADDAIATTQQAIAQARRVKEGLLGELLTVGIGRHRLTQTPVGEIPVHWLVSSPGELATFSGGHGFRPPDWSKSGLPIIRIQNLNGSEDFNYFAGEPDDKWIVEPGELLFAWAGSAGASFGPCIWPGPRGLLNQHIYKVRPKPGVNKLWLYETLSLITKQIERRAQGFKASLLHVHKRDITEQPIPLPPPDEQEAIAAEAETFNRVIEADERKLATLRLTKSGLCQDLLTGKVRVPS